MDTEFLVQMLQLKHGQDNPAVRVTGTLAALVALREQGLLSTDDADFLLESYRFQRSIEARIRLMDAAGRHEFPTDPLELAKLAFFARSRRRRQTYVRSRRDVLPRPRCLPADF